MAKTHHIEGIAALQRHDPAEISSKNRKDKNLHYWVSDLEERILKKSQDELMSG